MVDDLCSALTGSISIPHKPHRHLPPKCSSQTRTAHASYQATNPCQPRAPPTESGSTDPGVSPRICCQFLGQGLDSSKPLLLQAPGRSHTSAPQTHPQSATGFLLAPCVLLEQGKLEYGR